MSIRENIEAIRQTLPQDRSVTLVAVSKYYPVEALMTAYESAGQRVFGENRVQELRAKYEVAPKDIEWHLIGQLQRNKVKYIAPFIHTIHSVDSESLLEEIDKRAGQAEGRTAPPRVLLQIHIAQEETKSGLSPEEFLDLIASKPWLKYKNVEFAGMMTMATNTDDEAQIRSEFKQVSDLMKEVQAKADELELPGTFKELSMGMSHDYNIALEYGATIIRVGSKIFSE